MPKKTFYQGLAPSPYRNKGMSSSDHRLQRGWGMLIRKERWGLSWRCWLVTILAVVGAGSVVIFTIYPFLAVTHRLDTNVLVVEGWIHEYAIRAAVEEFRVGSYQWVFTTGGP